MPEKTAVSLVRNLMKSLNRLELSSPAAAAVLQFGLAALLSAAVITAGAYWVVSRNAISEATRNAQEVAAIDGRGIVEPNLTGGLAAGDAPSLAAFDRVVRDRVLSARVVRVKLLTPAGRVVYSDARELIGSTFSLGTGQATSLRESRVIAEVSPLNSPENRFDRRFGPLLEAYLPVHGPDGETFLFETYQLYAIIDDDQRRIWSAFFPVLAGGIGLLVAVQVPLAWRLARSLDRAQQEREKLLNRALEASALERRRIARDLHDGVVQALAGLAMRLSAGAGRADDPKVAGARLEDAAKSIRAAIGDLRSMIVEIAPPNLEGRRLEGVLTDLLAPLGAEGIETRLETEGLEAVGREAATILFRAAQESIRNASSHSDAKEVVVNLSVKSGIARLEVRDDGHGFTAERVIGRQREGHVGLAMLRSLVEDAGGRLEIASSADSGTVVTVAINAQVAE